MEKHMKRLPKSSVRRNSEQGSAGLKLLIALVIVYCVGHAGYRYIPVAYAGEDYKQKMNELVTQAYAMPNSPLNSPENVKTKLRAYGNDNGIPPEAFIKVEKAESGVMRAEVKFVKQVELLPFGLYKHNYAFDHIATPNGFLTK